jgi:hypothetical protein
VAEQDNEYPLSGIVGKKICWMSAWYKVTADVYKQLHPRYPDSDSVVTYLLFQPAEDEHGRFCDLNITTVRPRLMGDVQGLDACGPECDDYAGVDLEADHRVIVRAKNLPTTSVPSDAPAPPKNITAEYERPGVDHLGQPMVGVVMNDAEAGEEVEVRIGDEVCIHKDAETKARHVAQRITGRSAMGDPVRGIGIIPEPLWLKSSGDDEVDQAVVGGAMDPHESDGYVLVVRKELLEVLKPFLEQLGLALHDVGMRGLDDLPTCVPIPLAIADRIGKVKAIDGLFDADHEGGKGDHDQPREG